MRHIIRKYPFSFFVLSLWAFMGLILIAAFG